MLPDDQCSWYIVCALLFFSCAFFCPMAASKSSTQPIPAIIEIGIAQNRSGLNTQRLPRNTWNKKLQDTANAWQNAMRATTPQNAFSKDLEQETARKRMRDINSIWTSIPQQLRHQTVLRANSWKRTSQTQHRNSIALQITHAPARGIWHGHWRAMNDPSNHSSNHICDMLQRRLAQPAKLELHKLTTELASSFMGTHT